MLVLPTELQSQILSYLPIKDQLSAAKICPLWKDIVLNDKAIQRTRYSYSFSPIVCSHNLTSVWIEDGSKPAFSFMVQSGVIKHFRYPQGKRESGEEVQTTPDEDTTGETRKAFDRDITDCIFLDEPLLAPFPTSVPVPFKILEDNDQTPLLTRKQRQFTGNERVEGRSYVRYILYCYETMEDGTMAWLDPETTIRESDDVVISAALNIWSKTGQWSGDIWKAKVNPRNGTSVREILEAVFVETEPILRESGIKTENLHENFCIGFQISRGVWSLAFGVIADEEDTGYSSH
ncbi:hypothetical protein TWF506_002473 [Arthrobotrys conoides]|uniref:F-box domain-containing protein n=1 Tax=Arthrobotrys conoides TaxID=74498 RepID=A0AAN8NF30_9PEZI